MKTHTKEEKKEEKKLYYLDSSPRPPQRKQSDSVARSQEPLTLSFYYKPPKYNLLYTDLSMYIYYKEGQRADNINRCQEAPQNNEIKCNSHKHLHWPLKLGRVCLLQERDTVRIRTEHNPYLYQLKALPQTPTQSVINKTVFNIFSCSDSRLYY